MKFLCVFLGLLGCCLALTPGKQYTYHYAGRIGMGIPEIRNKVSGMGIKSDVIFQVQNEGKAIVKFTDIEVGEYLGDVNCNLYSPMPIRHSPLQGFAKTLEDPFEINFKNTEEEVMVVPKADLEWMVNMRKSVALMFMMEPLRLNFEPSTRDTHLPHYFSKVEPTIHGACSCDYTLIPMTKQTYTSEHTYPTDSNGMYKLIRSVDFTNCQDRVAIVSSSLGNVSETVFGQPSNLGSRWSVATMRLTGEPGNFRVESGSIEGSIVVNPTGTNTKEKLISITNQTIYLKSVTETQNPFSASGATRPVKTWFMELASPFAPPSKPVPWINYYSLPEAAYYPILPENIATGIPITEPDIQEFTHQLDKMITEIATNLVRVGGLPNDKIDLWNTNEAVIISLLDTATQTVPGIDVQNLQKLFDKYFNDKSEEGQMKHLIFIDICAASGLGSPVKMLLNNFNNGKISNERIASIFITLTNKLIATPLIPDLLKYVKSLDLKETPYLTTNVWVNFASALKRVCISKEYAIYNTPHPFFGKDQCHAEVVYNEMMTFFKEKMQQSIAPWEHMVIVQAIGNLGSHNTLHFFKTIISGEHSTTLKRHVIYSMTPNMMSNRMTIDKSMKEEVFKILMPVIEDFNQDSYIRQLALWCLTEWKPTPAFWQRLAVNSWKEPSPTMGAFIYNLIYANSQTTESKYYNGTNVVQLLLPFTKPYATSPKYSFFSLKGTVNPVEKTSTYYMADALKNDMHNVPMELYFAVFTNYGRSTLKLLETALLNDGESNMMENFFESTDESLNEFKTSGMFNPFTFILNVFEHCDIFTPVNIDTISRAFGKDGMHLVHSWISGKRVHLTKYFDATHETFYLPTELGLPVYARYNQPIINNAEGQTKLTIPESSNPTIFDIFRMKNIGVEFETSYKFAYKTIMSFQTVVPWTKKVITAGVETLNNFNLPGRFVIDVSHKNHIRNVSMEFSPFTQHPFVLANIQTVPYVARRSMYPAAEHYTKYERFEVVTIRDDQHGQIKEVNKMDKNTFGTNGHVHFEGDIYHPFTYGSFVDFLRHPILSTRAIFTPTVKMSSVLVVVDFGKSDTKSIKSSVAYGSYFNNAIKETTDTKLGEAYSTLYFNTLFEGSNSKFYEAKFTAKSTEEKFKKSEITMHVRHSALPHTPSQEYCLQLETNSPIVYDIRTLLKNVKSNEVDTIYKGVLKGGKSCSDRQLALIKGHMRVSHLRRERLAKELTETCNFGQRNPVNTFKTAPVYDELTFKVDFKQPFPEMAQNATNKLFDIVKSYNFPHVYNNYMNVKNQLHNIYVNGSRIIGHEHWNIRMEMPRENVIFDRFRLHPIIDQIIPVVYY